MEDREYWYWLCSTEGLGPITLRRLLALYRDPRVLWQETNLPIPTRIADALHQAKSNITSLREELDSLEKRGIFWCHFREETYPARLRELPDAPCALYWRGRLPDERPCAGIVGSRTCSPYGRSMAERFAGELAGAGVQIISGMAAGIDSHAQRAALHCGGSSHAVLGCGVDICYPPSNYDLYERLIHEGSIISEYRPGTKPLAGHFPPRNRIISGLSDVLLVMEAREKSGTSITVDRALEYGKDVFALPGRLSDSLSIGCNRLIAQGAGILTCTEDVLRALPTASPDTAVSLQRPDNNTEASSKAGQRVPARPDTARLSPAASRVLSHIGHEAVHLDALLTHSGLQARDVYLVLDELESAGFIRPVSTSYYARV